MRVQIAIDVLYNESEGKVKCFVWYEEVKECNFWICVIVFHYQDFQISSYSFHSML